MSQLITRIAILLTLGLTPLTAQADDLYADVIENCELGLDGRGNVVVGEDTISLINTYYRRASGEIPAGHEFMSAEYEIIKDGEVIGKELLKTHITPERVEILGDAGPLASAVRCPDPATVKRDHPGLK